MNILLGDFVPPLGTNPMRDAAQDSVAYVEIGFLFVTRKFTLQCVSDGKTLADMVKQLKAAVDLVGKLPRHTWYPGHSGCSSSFCYT